MPTVACNIVASAFELVVPSTILQSCIGHGPTKKNNNNKEDNRWLPSYLSGHNYLLSCHFPLFYSHQPGEIVISTGMLQLTIFKHHMWSVQEGFYGYCFFWSCHIWMYFDPHDSGQTLSNRRQSAQRHLRYTCGTFMAPCSRSTGP